MKPKSKLGFCLPHTPRVQGEQPSWEQAGHTYHGHGKDGDAASTHPLPQASMGKCFHLSKICSPTPYPASWDPQPLLPKAARSHACSQEERALGCSFLQEPHAPRSGVQSFPQGFNTMHKGSVQERYKAGTDPQPRKI